MVSAPTGDNNNHNNNSKTKSDKMSKEKKSSKRSDNDDLDHKKKSKEKRSDDDQSSDRKRSKVIDDNNEGTSNKKRTKGYREAESLEDSEHVREVKRLRAYENNNSIMHDGTNGSQQQKSDQGSQQQQTSPQRVRTRSFDMKEGATVTAAVNQQVLTTDEWRKMHSITIRYHGQNSANNEHINTNPYREFADTPFDAAIKQSFTRAGYTSPTAIQSQAWPVAVQKHDMICVAKTGSGKTCGFLLPYFHQYMLKKKQQSQQQRQPQQYRTPPSSTKPTLLVLAPTRELSVQIQEEASKFGKLLGIRSLCCYGGSAKGPQIGQLERGMVDCIIATPGRLNDLLEMKKVDLTHIECLVLDEVSIYFYLIFGFIFLRVP